MPEKTRRSQCSVQKVKFPSLFSRFIGASHRISYHIWTFPMNTDSTFSFPCKPIYLTKNSASERTVLWNKLSWDARTISSIDTRVRNLKSQSIMSQVGLVVRQFREIVNKFRTRRYQLINWEAVFIPWALLFFRSRAINGINNELRVRTTYTYQSFGSPALVKRALCLQMAPWFIKLLGFDRKNWFLILSDNRSRFVVFFEVSAVSWTFQHFWGYAPLELAKKMEYISGMFRFNPLPTVKWPRSKPLFRVIVDAESRLWLLEDQELSGVLWLYGRRIIKRFNLSGFCGISFRDGLPFWVNVSLLTSRCAPADNYARKKGKF